MAFGIAAVSVGAADVREFDWLRYGIARCWVRRCHRSEIVELYAHRADSPSELWLRLFNAAAGQLEMLVYAGFFLPEHSAKLVHTWPRLPAPG